MIEKKGQLQISQPIKKNVKTIYYFYSTSQLSTTLLVYLLPFIFFTAALKSS